MSFGLTHSCLALHSVCIIYVCFLAFVLLFNIHKIYLLRKSFLENFFNKLLSVVWNTAGVYQLKKSRNLMPCFFFLSTVAHSHSSLCFSFVLFFILLLLSCYHISRLMFFPSSTTRERERENMFASSKTAVYSASLTLIFSYFIFLCLLTKYQVWI